jgi:hypothetical protein
MTENNIDLYPTRTAMVQGSIAEAIEKQRDGQTRAAEVHREHVTRGLNDGRQ